MAKKKKKTSPQKKPRNNASSFSGTLADKLKSHTIQPAPKASSVEAPSQPPRPPTSDTPSREELLDGEELFLAALEAMPEPSTRQKQRGSSPFHGAFAEQLAGHVPFERRPRQEDDTSRQEDAPASADALREETAADVEPASRAKEAPRELTGEALFEHALDTMKPTDLFVGKYHGRVHNLPQPKKEKLPFTKESGEAMRNRKSRAERLEEEAHARQEIEALREEILFTRAVGGFDEVYSNQDKYHRQKPRAHAQPRSEQDEERSFYSSESPEALIAPPLPKSGEGLHRIEALHPDHRGLLNRARLWGRKNQMQSLNVRGDGVEDALRQIELFMHQQWKDGAQYVRIVHGRGLQSEEGIPVLKPSILHWLEGPGFRYVRGYAPELTQENDYGSLIVCLTKKQSGKDN